MVSRRRVEISVCTALALFALDTAVWPAAAHATPATIDSAKVIPWGGGHMTAISAEPGSDGERLLAAGDVAGVQWSNDGAETWVPANDGLAQGQTPVTAIAWHAGTPTMAWIAYGSTAGDHPVHGIASAAVDDEPGTLSEWTTLGRAEEESACDSGVSALQDASTLLFRGVKGAGDQTNNAGGRAVGNLLVDTGTRLYAGTLDGVYTSVAAGDYALGDCWRKVWPTSGTYAIRSLILDPSVADKLYAGTNDSGVWRISNADGTATAVQFSGYTSGAFRTAEELTFDLDGTLWCACGEYGVWSSTNPGSGTPPALLQANGGVVECTHIGSGGCAEPHGHSQWYSAIEADSDGVWAATSDPYCPSLCHALFRHTASAWAAGPYAVNTTLLGSCGLACPTWWLSEFNTARMLGKADPDSGNSLFIPTGAIAVGTGANAHVLLAGTGGVWHSSGLAANATWQPTSVGLGLTIMRADTVGPSGYVYIGDQDHAFIGADPSTDPITVKSSTSDDPPQAVGSFAVAADPVIDPDRVYLGVSDPDCAFHEDSPVEGCLDPKGSLYWRDDPMNTALTAWNKLNLHADAEKNRPVGLAAGVGTATCSGDDQPMDLLVAVARNGLWRYRGCGDSSDSWTPVSSSGEGNFICGNGTGNPSDMRERNGEPVRCQDSGRLAETARER
jgi:hypothetical protein